MKIADIIAYLFQLVESRYQQPKYVLKLIILRDKTLFICRELIEFLLLQQRAQIYIFQKETQHQNLSFQLIELNLKRLINYKLEQFLIGEIYLKIKVKLS